MGGCALEIGSNLDFFVPPEGARLPYPEPAAWYARGQQAIVGLIDHLAQDGTARSLIHVPDYFCPEVVKAWQGVGIDIRFYPDDPRWLEPDFAALRPEPDDIVLVFNSFGVREPTGWPAWQDAHPDVLLLEDHTQDPCSRWARQSRAHYAFASIHKTFPVTEGAVLWSPIGRSLPVEPAAPNWQASGLKLAAMALKHHYLTAGIDEPRAKALFRNYFQASEDVQLTDQGAALTPWSRAFLADGYPVLWRQRWAENVRRFLDLLGEPEGCRPLFTNWPDGHCPMGAFLVFSHQRLRDHVRAELITQRIYCPVYWSFEERQPGRVRDLGARILCVPLDHRYGAEDVERVAAALHDSLRTALSGGPPDGASDVLGEGRMPTHQAVEVAVR